MTMRRKREAVVGDKGKTGGDGDNNGKRGEGEGGAWMGNSTY